MWCEAYDCIHSDGCYCGTSDITISKEGICSDYERKAEPQREQCDTCKHKGKYAYCRLCGRHNEDNYEPQTEHKKWETKPKADKPTEITTCVQVPAFMLEDEPQTERSE